jgi:alpha-ribazole phosphatase
MNVYLIRHTTPEVQPGTCYGQSDIGLKTTFAEETRMVRNKLPSSWNRIYCSPLRRCRQLAEQLASSPMVDDRLQELNFGDWEGCSWNGIALQELQPWMDDFVNVACPQGESYQRLSERVTAFWQDLPKNSLETVLVVTHAGPIRAILGQVLQLPLAHSFRLAVDYGGVSLVRLQNQYATIQFINK